LYTVPKPPLPIFLLLEKPLVAVEIVGRSNNGRSRSSTCPSDLSTKWRETDKEIILARK